MPKSKEILFRTKNGGRTYEGKRGNLIFELVDVRGVDDVDSIYIVKVQHKVIDTLGFTTCGHRSFPLEKAKEFCQQIADGEIDPEALLMEFAAEDMEKEEAAIRDATARAKTFRAKLDEAGLTFMRFRELMSLYGIVGDIGHNLLLEWDRKEVPHNG